MWALVRRTVYVSILGVSLITAVRLVSQQSALELATFKTNIIKAPDDDSLHLYLLDNLRGLQIDLTDQPCFRDLLSENNVMVSDRYLWIARDEQGFFIMKAVDRSTCYLLQ